MPFCSIWKNRYLVDSTIQNFVQPVQDQMDVDFLQFSTTWILHLVLGSTYFEICSQTIINMIIYILAYIATAG